MPVNIISTVSRCFFAFTGGLIAIIEPALPYIGVCYLFVLGDCYTAWKLSRRAKKRFPNKASGKFKSVHFGEVISTMAEVSAAIVLGHLAQQIVLEGLPMAIPNVVAGAVIFWQAWSMLENKSSCNDAKWARVMQRIMVDKTERHFDINLDELKPKRQRRRNGNYNKDNSGEDELHDFQDVY